LILPISAAQIDHFRENFLQVEEETNVYQEYFNYVLSNSDLQEPRDWKEAENYISGPVVRGKRVEPWTYGSVNFRPNHPLSI